MTQDFCHENFCVSELAHLDIEGKTITKDKEIMYDIRVVKNNGNIYNIKRNQQSLQQLRKAIKCFAKEMCLKEVLDSQKKMKKLLTKSNSQLKRLEEFFNQFLEVEEIRTFINQFVMPEDWFCVQCHENRKRKPSEADSKMKFNQSVVSKPFQYPKFKVIRSDGLPPDLKQPTPAADDIVQVFRKDFSGWWCVLYKEKLICFPSSYLRPETSQGDDDDSSALETSEEYIAKKSYTACKDDEISFNEGDLVRVIRKRYDGWWMVEVENRNGLAPAVYLEETSRKDPQINRGFSEEIVETRL